jgi:hypothetical protein
MSYDATSLEAGVIGIGQRGSGLSIADAEQMIILNKQLRRLVKWVHSFFGSEGESTWWPSPSLDEPGPADASSSSFDGPDRVSSSEEYQLRVRVCFVLACEATRCILMDPYGCGIMPPGLG